MCSFEDMSKTNPNCCYTTMHEMEVAWRVLEQDAQQARLAFTAVLLVLLGKYFFYWV